MARTGKALAKKVDHETTADDDPMPAATERPIWAKGLTDREYVFVHHYLVSLNASEAARCAGYSAHTANVLGCKIKKRPHVREAIAMALKDELPTLKLTIAERLAAIVETRADELMTWSTEDRRVTVGVGKKRRTFNMRTPVMTIKSTDQLTPRQLAAVKGIRQRVGLGGGSTLELQMHDPINAAERLSRMFNLEDPDANKGAGGAIFVLEIPEGATMRRIDASDAEFEDVTDYKQPDVRSRMAHMQPAEEEEVPPGGTRFVIEK